MKKQIIMIFMLVASVGMVVNATPLNLHRFYSWDFYNSKPTVEQGIAAHLALFSGNDQEAGKYWNPAVSLVSIRDIFALHIQETFKMDKPPSDEDMYAMVSMSEVIYAPAGFDSQYETSGIVKGTTKQQYFSRPATPGEQFLAIKSIVWTSLGCGNPTRKKFSQNVPIHQPEEFDRPIEKKPIYQMACQGCPPGTDRNGNVNVTVTPTLTNSTLAPTGNSGNGDNSALLMAMLMQNMNNNRQSNEPVRTRANAVEIIGAVASVGGLAYDIFGNRNQRGYSQREYRSIPPLDRYTPPIYREEYREQPEYRYPQQPEYRYPRQPEYNYPPRQPREYDPGIWPERRYDPDYQGGSGDYRIPPRSRYDNTNASGLGVGEGRGSYNDSYNPGYNDRRNSPLQNNGGGQYTDTRNGRTYQTDQRYRW